MSTNEGVTGSGGCLCGGVRFETRDTLRGVVFCHCDMCQVFHGSATAYTTCAYDKLDFISDETLVWYQSSEAVKRGFCSKCGASMFFASDHYPEGLGITAGCLDKPTGLKSKSHIFVASKADYYDITDGLPQLDEE